MANHAFIHFKKRVPIAGFREMLNDINKKHFNNLLTIKQDHNYYDTDRIFVIQYRDDPWAAVSIWLSKDGKKLEWPHKGDDICWWLQEFFAVHVGEKYGGVKSDEGCEGEWKPDFHLKYSTFWDYCARHIGFRYRMELLGHFKKSFFSISAKKLFARSIYKEYIDLLPAKMRSLAIFKKGKYPTKKDVKKQLEQEPLT